MHGRYFASENRTRLSRVSFAGGREAERDLAGMAKVVKVYRGRLEMTMWGHGGLMINTLEVIGSRV